MTSGRLPIGIQSFREIRERDLLYVDKTAYARQLIGETKHNFLSRPRRFGKSLFVGMLKELFEGNEELFRGLAVHGDWDWDDKHPVVRLDFGSGRFSGDAPLEDDVREMLYDEECAFGLRSERPDASVNIRLTRLIRDLHRSSGRRVVLLVDEYDRPISNTLETLEVAKANRDTLSSLYAVTKTCDDHIKFSFFTGVNRFIQMGLFSGANNLTDISLAPRYSAICGYTEADLDRVFAQGIGDLDREEIREWYNGYSWRGEERLYNPHSVLRLLAEREFKAWWHRTGMTDLLAGALARSRVASLDLEGLVMNEDDLSAFDLGGISIEALLFQTGYLTIGGDKPQDGTGGYSLSYPNRELRQILSRELLDTLTPEAAMGAPVPELRSALLDGDAGRLMGLLHAFFAGIPHQWYARDEVARSEVHYATSLRALFAGAEFDVRSEESTDRGRMDLAVLTGTGPYVFELKIADPANPGAALKQIHDRGYGERYAGGGLPVRLVGIEFDPGRRNIGLLRMDPGDGGEIVSVHTSEEPR